MASSATSHSKETLPMAEIMLGTNRERASEEGGKRVSTCCASRGNDGLPRTNSPPVETIAGEAGVPHPQADRRRNPISSQRKSRSPDPVAIAR